MYSKKEIDKALKLYHKCKSVTKVIQKLEYPSRRVLYNWIKKENLPNLPRKQLILINNPKHPRNPPIEVKMEILHRCFVLGESVKLVSEDVGYTRVSIYSWRRLYIEKGSVSLINNRNITLGPLKEGQRVSDQDIEQVLLRMKEMQLEIDILKETIDVLKKDPGINKTPLKNKEKIVIIDALKTKYKLQILLKKLNLPKISYYYNQNILNKPNKYLQVSKRIKTIFSENYKCYGYRRIHGKLKKKIVYYLKKLLLDS